MNDVNTTIEPKPAEHKYTIAKRERANFTNAVLQSTSVKRLVIAGPGTGKTHLFKEVVRGKKNTITLSFVTALIEDLSVELCGLTDVRTLHSFARGVAQKIKLAAASGEAKKKVQLNIFPQLSTVIAHDSRLLRDVDVEFDADFRNLRISENDAQFYLTRRKYYNQSGFTDVVFFLFQYFKQHPEAIPKYDHVLVDEYQDFNAMEVALIDLLAESSPILIAGDDDQSLYQALTSANPAHIRERCQNDSNFEKFELPYCSRCTRVIVNAINDVLEQACQAGHLKDRAKKEYRYYDDDKKDHESDRYPKITHAKCRSNGIPTLITKYMSEFADWKKKQFSVMIICPTNNRRIAIARKLKDRGFKNVKNPAPRQDELNLLGALRLLLKNKDCNLGWRIAAQELMEAAEFQVLLKQSLDCTQQFSKLMPLDLRKRIRTLRTTLRKVLEDDEVESSAVDELLNAAKIDPRETATMALRARIAQCDQCDAAIRNTQIIVSTIPSSKGLAADLVFIPYFDDRVLFRSADKTITDQDVWNAIVAFTRARTKLVLISTAHERPKLLEWIHPDRIESVVGPGFDVDS